LADFARMYNFFQQAYLSSLRRNPRRSLPALGRCLESSLDAPQRAYTNSQSTSICCAGCCRSDWRCIGHLGTDWNHAN